MYGLLPKRDFMWAFLTQQRTAQLRNLCQKPACLKKSARVCTARLWHGLFKGHIVFLFESISLNAFQSLLLSFNLKKRLILFNAVCRTASYTMLIPVKKHHCCQ